MMHHGVKAVKERVMSLGLCVLVSLGTVSLHAMDEDFKKPEAENTQVPTTSMGNEVNKGMFTTFYDALASIFPQQNGNTQPAKPQVDPVLVVPLVEQEVNKDVNVASVSVAQVEDAPKIIRSETTVINNNSIESAQIQDKAAIAASTIVVEQQSQAGTNITNPEALLSKEQDPVQKQSVPAESFWKNITFQGLAQNEKVLYGIGAVGILTIGTVCYVLYKKGVFKKLCVSMKKHPWCTAAITGVAALSAAAGALYLSGADKESVMNFMNGIKTQIQSLPGTIKNSLPTFGQAKAA